MKKIALVLCAGMALSAFSGCLSNAEKTASSAISSAASTAESAVASEVKAVESAATSTVDAATSASPKESSKPEDVVKGLSKDGFWLFAILSDVTVDKEIVVDGEFHDKDDASAKLYRKLALYAQDADHKVTAEYTLTAPKMTVNSPNFRIQNGTFKGDVFVNADGFELKTSKIEGNLTFASEAVKGTALLTEGTVTGTTSVGGATDAVASASPKESSNPDDIIKGLSKDGYWIFSVLSDVTLDKELVVDGEFHDGDDAAKKVYRKLALYAQDADRNITAQYTLTVPKITVNSPGFRIQNGTVKGDVYVTADGFDLNGCTIDGNLTFATEAAKTSAILDKGTVKGTVAVG